MLQPCIVKLFKKPGSNREGGHCKGGTLQWGGGDHGKTTIKWDVEHTERTPLSIEKQPLPHHLQGRYL